MNGIEILHSLGWEILIRAEIGKPLQASIWRPDWVTPNLAASMPCPTFSGSNLEDVILQALDYAGGSPP